MSDIPAQLRAQISASTDPDRLEQIAQEIETDRAASEVTDEIRREARLSGLRCSCCDEPIPADHLGTECPECETLDY